MEQIAPRILIGVPCERAVMVEAMNGLIKIATRVARYGWEWFDFSYRRTDVARNMMGHCLLDSDMEYVCMLDSDHMHHEATVERLVSCAMAKPDIKIVAGMNYRRGPGYEPMAYIFVGERQLMAIEPPKEPALLPCDAVSTASILIHREVFEAMEPPWFRYNYDTYNEGDCGTEDIYFCRRVRAETDYQVWVHTGIVSPHLRLATVGDGSTRARYLEERANVAS